MYFFNRHLVKLGNDGFSLVLFGTKVSDSEKFYKRSNQKLFLLLIYLLLFSGCSLTRVPNPTPSELQNSISRLSIMIEDLNSTIKKEEAKDLAKKAILYSKKLSKKYELVSPPLWHNTLVNIGIKKRGLCYQWADDLLKYLHQKRYDSLILHYVGANIGGYFEHNALAVSAKGMSLKNSILLDAWRDSGNLFFIKLKEDKRYRWKSRDDMYEMMFPHLKRWGKF